MRHAKNAALVYISASYNWKQFHWKEVYGDAKPADNGKLDLKGELLEAFFQRG